MSTLTWITEKELERKVKNKETNFVGTKHNDGKKKEKLAATKVKMSCSENKSEQEHVKRLKRVTRKFLEFSYCCRAEKQRQRNVLKKVCCTCKVGFFFLEFLAVFVGVTLSITWFSILFLLTINIRLTKASLFAQAKSIHSMLWLVNIWQVSSCRKFIQHLETCLLIAEADRVLCHLVMVLTVFFHWMYKIKYSCHREYSTTHGWSTYWVFG